MATDESDVAAAYEEAGRLAEAGRYDEAAAAYQEVLDEDPNNADAQVGYARVLMADGRMDAAQAYLEPIAPDAEDGRIPAELGRAYYALSVFDKAIPMLERATALIPEDGHIKANYGFALWEGGEREAALDILKDAMPMIQDDTTLAANMGQIYMQLGMWSEAVTSLERYLLDHPNDLERRVSLAYSLKEAGWSDEAETVLEEILTIDAEFQQAKVQLQVLRSEREETRGEDGAEPAPASDDQPKIIEMRPLDLKVDSAEDTGDPIGPPPAAEDAFADFGDIRVIDETTAQQATVQALMEKIAPFLTNDDVDKAIETLEREIESAEHPAEVHNLIGKLKIEVEDYPTAIEAFRAAIDDDPFHAQAHNNLAVLLWQMGDFDDALNIVQKAIELDTEDMDARVNLALICHQVALHEEATTLYMQYLEQFPEDNKIRMELADCFVQMDETESALREYDTVLLLEPDNEHAQTRYDELAGGGPEAGGDT